MALSVCGLSGPARRAYDWLRHTQRADGSWPKRTEAGVVTDAAAESNQTAYVAVGTWHEFQLTGDTAFLAQMWPVVRRAIGFVLDLQLPAGRDRLAADGGRDPGPLRAADRVLQHVPEPAVRGPAGPAGRRAATALGAGRPAARSRGGRPPRGVRGQEPLLDGLVLPGAGRPGARPGRPGPARFGMGGVRGPGPGGALRPRRAVGDRGGNLRAGHGARRRRGLATGPWRCSGRSSTCGTPTAVTGPAGSTRTRRTSRTSGAAGPRRR